MIQRRISLSPEPAAADPADPNNPILPRWTCWDAVDVPAYAASVESARLGCLDAPDENLEPTQAPTMEVARARGWTVDRAWMLCRWNVPGGFTFLP